MVRLLHLVPKGRARWLNGAVETSYRILLIAAVPCRTPLRNRNLRHGPGAIRRVVECRM
jgi:hypothetical protein